MAKQRQRESDLIKREYGLEKPVKVGREQWCVGGGTGAAAGLAAGLAARRPAAARQLS